MCKNRSFSALTRCDEVSQMELKSRFPGEVTPELGFLRKYRSPSGNQKITDLSTD